MVLVYVRHSIDEEEDATYQHDAKLTRRGKSKCKDKARSLVRKYGPPSIIAVSPFLRTRETAKQFRRYLRKKGHRVDIVIDPMLGRYFTERQRLNPDMRTETRELGAIVDGSESELHARIHKHATKVLSRGYHTRDKVIWCVTHGVVVKKLFRLVGVGAPDRIEFLQSFVMPPEAEIQSLG